MNKRYGGLVEWPMAPAWKVGEAQASEGSNPLSSAIYNLHPLYSLYSGFFIWTIIKNPTNLLIY